MVTQTMRALVIGAGSIGTRHLRLIHGMGFSVMGCDTEPKAFDAIRKEIPDLATFTSLAQALAQRPELVVVATPPQVHADHTVAAMEAGAHVLCEKPMADTLPNADRMIAAAKEHRKVLHIGFVNRYHPCLVRVKELVDSGRLGRVLFAQADLGSYFTLICSRSRYQATTYAALLLDYTHQLDFVPWILGAPATRLYAVGQNLGAFELKSNPSMIAMLLEHAGGPVSEIHLDYCRKPQMATLHVTGDRAYVLCDLMTAKITLGNRADDAVDSQTLTYERDDLFREQFRQFVAAAEGKPARIVSGAEGRCSLQLVERAIESMQSRSPVWANASECQANA